jgi:hypothetical protein
MVLVPDSFYEVLTVPTGFGIQICSDPTINTGLKGKKMGVERIFIPKSMWGLIFYHNSCQVGASVRDSVVHCWLAYRQSISIWVYISTLRSHTTFVAVRTWKGLQFGNVRLCPFGSSCFRNVTFLLPAMKRHLISPRALAKFFPKTVGTPFDNMTYNRAMSDHATTFS